jgi:RimJ/RimL family protein N-acetyltransferase
MYAGNLIRLRPFEREDAEKYRQWVNDAGILRLVDRVLPVTKDEHLRWYERMISSKDVVIFAIEVVENKDFIGCAWLYDIDYRHLKAEVRLLIGDNRCWGRGYGTEAITLLVKFAFENLNLHKVYADVLVTNERSLRAFQKVKFTQEGCFRSDRYVAGQYVDVVRLGLLRDDWSYSGCCD